MNIPVVESTRSSPATSCEELSDISLKFDRILRKEYLSKIGELNSTEYRREVIVKDTARWPEIDRQLYEEVVKKLESEEHSKIDSIDINSCVNTPRNNGIGAYRPRSETLTSQSSFTSEDGDLLSESSPEKSEADHFGGQIECEITCETSRLGKCSKKKKRKKKGTLSPSAENLRSYSQQPMFIQDMKSEFDKIVSAGISLLLASSLGSTRAVTVTLIEDLLTWGKPCSKSISSIKLRAIKDIVKGTSMKAYLDSEIYQRSFTFSLKNESVTFIAPTSIERDALFNGFKSLLEIGDELNLTV